MLHESAREGLGVHGKDLLCACWVEEASCQAFYCSVERCSQAQHAGNSDAKQPTSAPLPSPGCGRTRVTQHGRRTLILISCHSPTCLFSSRDWMLLYFSRSPPHCSSVAWSTDIPERKGARRSAGDQSGRTVGDSIFTGGYLAQRPLSYKLAVA